MFVKGIKIDQTIFCQMRIEEGKVGKGMNQKFIFHPSFYITTQVFS